MRKHLALFVVMLSAACSQSPPDRSAPAARVAPGFAQAAPQPPQSGLAVLMPEAMARQESTGPGVTVADTHYSLTQRDEKMTLSLTGSLVSRDEASIDAPRGVAAATLRGVPVYVTENEGIKTATWVEQGTAYAMDIECTSASDTRCTSPDYILDVIKGLVKKPGR